MCDFCIFPPAFEVNYGACVTKVFAVINGGRGQLDSV